MVIRLATGSRNASTDAVVDRVDAGPAAGKIEIRTGAQPATGDTAASGTLLATVTLADPAFGASAAGTAAGTDPAAVDPVASGAAGWFRVLDSNNASVFDGNVTATGGGGDMTLSNINLAPGISTDITSLSYTTPA